MGKYRLGGYIFVTQHSDHPPRHVHVYRDGKLVVKCDLEHECPMKGKADRRILKLLDRLRKEGLV